MNDDFTIVLLFLCFQLFSYTNISPVNAMSGMISPTNLSMFTSPATTPRSTPRTTPVPRWNGPFITLDENLDYNMMAGLMPNTNTDPDGPHIIEAEGEIEGKSHHWIITWYPILY